MTWIVEKRALSYEEVPFSKKRIDVVRISLPPLGQNVPVARFEWRIAALGAAAIGKVSAKLTDEGLTILT